MKKYLLYIVLFFCFTQQSKSQEDVVISFDIPVRNSLKFNKYIINPTFSFVREQNKYISFYNKRQWVQFDDAPQTYLFSYSGRFRENIGVGVGLFQQNYGVLTTFGGVLNFAYNVTLARESNLTFGMNLGFYKSGLNESQVITNFPDPSLEKIPTSSLITINPGINYGTTFLDFGVSLNNLVLYNVKASKLIEDDIEQSIQAHIMYTGYISSRGFFDESKFSGLIKSEFKKNKTVVSGIMMLTSPKGIWGQTGYNSLYGISAGIGVNISTQISIEYNYEKAIGDLSTFGSSHEITLAYKFKNNNRFNYSGDEKEESIIISGKKKTRSSAKRKSTNNAKPYKNAEARAKIKATTEAEEIARLAVEIKAKEDEAIKAKVVEDAKLEAAKVKAEEQFRIKQEAEETKIEAAKVKAEQTKIEEAASVKLAQETQAKVEAEQEAKIKLQELEEIIIPVPTDNTSRSMYGITKLTEESKIIQSDLLIKLQKTVGSKKQDLKDLKEENDLSEKGIYKAPKPFKSVTAENIALESLKFEIDDVIKNQNIKISELEILYNERLRNVPNKKDSSNVFYLKTLQSLKLKQIQVVQTRENLVTTLEEIKIASEIERKRRIKRAAYDNEEDKYLKDRAALNQIKKYTPLSPVSLKAEDFDFGEEQSNIQIVKDVKNEESGYYLVIAVHNDVTKRDESLTKVVSTGQSNINFFYDVNTSKYYIYYRRFDGIDEAIKVLKTKGSEPYNSKMSMVKIEN